MTRPFLLAVVSVASATLLVGCSSPQWSAAKKKDTLPAYGEYLCVNDSPTEEKSAKDRINELLEPIKKAKASMPPDFASEKCDSAVAALVAYLETQFPIAEYNTTLDKTNLKEKLIKAIQAESPLVLAYTLKQHPLIKPKRGNTRVVGYVHLVEIAGQDCTLVTDAFDKSRKTLTLSGCGFSSYSKVWLPGNEFGGKINGGSFSFNLSYQAKAKQSGHVSIVTSYPSSEGLW